MKGIIVPAAYVPYIEAELSHLAERIRCNELLRTDADERVRGIRMIPDTDVLVGVTGRVTIMLVGGKDATSIAAVEPGG